MRNRSVIEETLAPLPDEEEITDEGGEENSSDLPTVDISEEALGEDFSPDDFEIGDKVIVTVTGKIVGMKNGLSIETEDVSTEASELGKMPMDRYAKLRAMGR